MDALGPAGRAAAALTWDAPTDSTDGLRQHVISGPLEALLADDAEAAALLIRLLRGDATVAGSPRFADLRARGLLAPTTPPTPVWEAEAALARDTADLPPRLVTIVARMSRPERELLASRVACAADLSAIVDAFAEPQLSERIGALPSGCASLLMAMVDRPDDVLVPADVEHPVMRERFAALTTHGFLLSWPDAERRVLPLDVSEGIALLRLVSCAERARAMIEQAPVPATPGPASFAVLDRGELRAAFLLRARGERPLPAALETWLRDRGAASAVPSLLALLPPAVALDGAPLHPLDLSVDALPLTLLQRALREGPLHDPLVALFGVSEPLAGLASLRDLFALVEAQPDEPRALVRGAIARRASEQGLGAAELDALREIGMASVERVEGWMGETLRRTIAAWASFPEGSTVTRDALGSVVWALAARVVAEDYRGWVRLSRDWGGRPPVRGAASLLARDAFAPAEMLASALVETILVPLGLSAVAPDGSIAFRWPAPPPPALSTRAPWRTVGDGEVIIEADLDAPIALLGWLLAGNDPEIDGNLLRFRIPLAVWARVPAARRAWGESVTRTE